jgi:hypothetical protein
LKGLEATNIATAFVDLAIILALFTPLADPARISVADQTARLTSGRVSPDAFDWRFLRFGAGRYGRDALQALAKGGKGPRAADIARRAQEALKSTSRWPYVAPASLAQPAPAPLADRVVMHPAGTRLPQTFLDQASAPNWSFNLNLCTPEAKCDGYLLDLGPADRGDLLISQSTGSVDIFRQDAAGRWTYRGEVPAGGCPDAVKALGRGAVQAVAPEVSDLAIGGRRYRIGVAESCGAAMKAAPPPFPPQRVLVSPAKAR